MEETKERRTPPAYQAERYGPILIDENGKKEALYGEIEDTPDTCLVGVAGSGTRLVGIQSRIKPLGRNPVAYVINKTAKDYLCERYILKGSVGESKKPKLKQDIYGYHPRAGKYQVNAEQASPNIRGNKRILKMLKGAALDAVSSNLDDTTTDVIKRPVKAARTTQRVWRNTKAVARASERAIRRTAKVVRISGRVAKTILTNPLVVKGAILGAVVILSIAVLLGAVSTVTAVIPTISLKSDNKEITRAYEYVTQLDADMTSELRELVAANSDVDEIHVYVNGYESSVSALEIVTNPDAILLYFDCKYEDYAFDKFIYGLFGGNNIKDEIQAIHEAMYTFSYNRWEETEKTEATEETIDAKDETEPNRITHLDINLTAKSFAAYLQENTDRLTAEEWEQYNVLSAVGIYTAKAELSSPFEGKNYYLNSRWGWKCREDGSTYEHTGVDIFMPVGTPINNVLYGTVTSSGYNETDGNYITIENGERKVCYKQLRSVIVSADQVVNRGDVIGTVGINHETGSAALHLEYYIEDGFETNPVFFLDGAVIAGTGAGSNDIVSVAASQIGNIGGQPYWSWYGFGSRVEWCACFVSWCAAQCGYIDTGIVPKFAGCDYGVNWFQSVGLWQNGGGQYTPKAGDIIFFDYEPNGAANHVGIVASVEGTLVYTIEGNSNDRCKQCTYSIYDRSIMGYGTPAYLSLR